MAVASSKVVPISLAIARRQQAGGGLMNAPAGFINATALQAGEPALERLQRALPEVAGCRAKLHLNIPERYAVLERPAQAQHGVKSLRAIFDALQIARPLRL